MEMGEEEMKRVQFSSPRFPLCAEGGRGWDKRLRKADTVEEIADGRNENGTSRRAAKHHRELKAFEFMFLQPQKCVCDSNCSDVEMDRWPGAPGQAADSLGVW